MLEFPEYDPDAKYDGSYKADTSIALAKNYVHLTVKSFYLYQKREHCQVTMVKERLSQDTLVIYLQKNSPYTSLFDDV